jgi:hypothetical protein
VAFYGIRSRRREERRILRRRRPLGCLWLVLGIVLIVVLLGLLFGGYRKGTKVSAPVLDLRPPVSASHIEAQTSGRTFGTVQ